MEALNHEVKLHAYFNMKDHPLFFNQANQTTEKFLSPRGKPLSAEHKAKISQPKTGKRLTKQTRFKLSQIKSQKRNLQSESHKKSIQQGVLKQLAQKIGDKISPETRQKMSQKKKGIPQGPRTLKEKKKISIGMRQFHAQQKKVFKTCTYCRKCGYEPGITIWHFENCRQKPDL